jgi:protein tyrosine phosphatase
MAVINVRNPNRDGSIVIHCSIEVGETVFRALKFLFQDLLLNIEFFKKKNTIA